METVVKLSDISLPPVAEQLRALEIGDAISLNFPLERYKYVAFSIWKLKSEGYKFTMRTLNGKIYVWRLL